MLRIGEILLLTVLITTPIIVQSSLDVDEFEDNELLNFDKYFDDDLSFEDHTFPEGPKVSEYDEEDRLDDHEDCGKWSAYCEQDSEWGIWARKNCQAACQEVEVKEESETARADRMQREEQEAAELMARLQREQDELEAEKPYEQRAQEFLGDLDSADEAFQVEVPVAEAKSASSQVEVPTEQPDQPTSLHSQKTEISSDDVHVCSTKSNEFVHTSPKASSCNAGPLGQQAVKSAKIALNVAIQKESAAKRALALAKAFPVMFTDRTIAKIMSGDCSAVHADPAYNSAKNAAVAAAMKHSKAAAEKKMAKIAYNNAVTAQQAATTWCAFTFIFTQGKTLGEPSSEGGNKCATPAPKVSSEVPQTSSISLLARSRS
jgi:hypothetical protein